MGNKRSDVETGLYYLNTRYYDPEVRRFLSADDVSYLDPGSVNGLNLYAYCLNNPVMGYDPMGTWDWGNFWKITGGLVLIGGLVAGTILTGGALSVVLAGAAIGAIGGGVGAGVSTILSGGNISDFANAFLVGTVSGAISGAVAASPLGIGSQIAVNSILGAANYSATQALSGQKITLGGLVANTVLGSAMGFVGGNGFMNGNTAANAFAAFGGRNFFSHLVQYVGMNTLYRVGVNSLVLGGTASGAYSRFISNKFNEEGAFFGW